MIERDEAMSIDEVRLRAMTIAEMISEYEKRKIEAAECASRCDFGSSGRYYFNGKVEAYGEVLFMLSEVERSRVAREKDWAERCGRKS